ncbi:MAG: phosphoribosylformylglycinamidine synthase [Clostridia bacterium]|nr:phosphoribosylformylglycinamidine synthase [Clostridia bacterium]
MQRIFVEKKIGFDVEARGMLEDLRENLGLKNLQGVRLANRYDIEGLSDEEYERAKSVVFFEPNVDNAYEWEIPVDKDEHVIAIEYLPGQYDQRADSAAVCTQILTQGEKPLVRVARLIILKGALTGEETDRVRHYCLNPVDSREASLEMPETLVMSAPVPEDIKEVEGFIGASEDEIAALGAKMGFAMDKDDLLFCQAYFRDTERRNPSVTEMRVIDTYWSDHCRHTTFGTIIDDAYIADECVKAAFEEYKKSRAAVGRGKKPMCLMDIATIAPKQLKMQGKLCELDESEEINACSIRVDVEVDGKTEPWLIMFKNETHNHPTEIEPFGGAATCLGGAIRDPLSGRSYVYQAMRVTGSGDVRTRIEDTLAGKLPQRKISRTAAAGYSSYGNQIGLATGQVAEIYHEGYVAKRLEIGAVIGAAPAKNVRRERPAKGDVIILLGGRTGRDGCGGATGSSKAHTVESLETCGAEVQKGNPPEERKLQRLMRNGDATALIKRCNDFGAGGVSVAIGELAAGLEIDLDKLPKKYEGLDGTELAISESQERMAVVVADTDAEKFLELASKENLEATVVAVVTDTNRLVMHWRGKVIVDISREFLDTNGAEKHTVVQVEKMRFFENGSEGTDIKKDWLKTLSDINVCSQKGLCERFDSTIGAASVLMPFGGITQLTPAEGMAAKLPVDCGETDMTTLMTYGFDPYISENNPFDGAICAVAESVAKIAAMGGDYRRVYLTFQEYFEKLGTNPLRWGKPFAALLGAYEAQIHLGLGAIGGKDSMSGSFGDMDVPPTLVSFAVATANAKEVLSPEFKKAGNKIALFKINRDHSGKLCFEDMHKAYDAIYKANLKGIVKSASVVRRGGICAALSRMCFGNMLGAVIETDEPLFAPLTGSIIAEVQGEMEGAQIIGATISDSYIEANGVKIGLPDALEAWEKPLEKVFPTRAKENTNDITTAVYDKRTFRVAKNKIARPKVFIPVFPGTNCEYDSARAFEKAGAAADVAVFRNLTMSEVAQSLEEFAKRIDEAQIIMLPGGFSGGDEPDGSGKFIAAAFRNERVREATMRLLNERDGLMLGICNGFQALIKLGLVPFGEIRDITPDCPTLTFNNVGRHISTVALTKVTSVLSPWFSCVNAGDIHAVAFSHGEGRFAANRQWLDKLAQSGQVATRYVDTQGNPSNDIRYNPNGSDDAIEGITSPDGRILGKMGHNERAYAGLLKNIDFNTDQKIFESGVKYFI